MKDIIDLVKLLAKTEITKDDITVISIYALQSVLETLLILCGVIITLYFIYTIIRTLSESIRFVGRLSERVGVKKPGENVTLATIVKLNELFDHNEIGSKR